MSNPKQLTIPFYIVSLPKPGFDNQREPIPCFFLTARCHGSECLVFCIAAYYDIISIRFKHLDSVRGKGVT